MSSGRLRFVSAALASLLAATGAAAAAPKQAPDNTAKDAESAAPMTRDAVERLYAGRTWLWEKNGAGYFSAKANRFVARTTTGSGKGDWYVTGNGKLCMRALWAGKSDSGTGAITCFLHREKDGVVYQRSSLGGQWYVFRNNPVGKNDEARKLVKGDRVSAAPEARL